MRVREKSHPSVRRGDIKEKSPPFYINVKRKVSYAMKRVAAGAHLPTPWHFEPAEREDDRADYCLGRSFLPKCKHHVLVFPVEWTGVWVTWITKSEKLSKRGKV